jgi:hypothetical protein
MAESRKTVTIVFADVTGSTALGEQTDPETMRRIMERYSPGRAKRSRRRSRSTSERAFFSPQT